MRIKIFFCIFIFFANLYVWAEEIQNDNLNFFITDKANRKVLIKKPFTRIISLYGAHTENLFALGLDKQIVGVSKTESFPPAALTKQKFSYHDDIERFLALKPDLILIRPMIDRGYPKLISALEKRGITVISLQPANIDELYQYWQKLGKLTGKQKESEKMIQVFKQAVNKTKELSRSVTKAKSVYFEAIHSKMKTFSPNSMPIFLLECVGGINIASDAKPVRQTNIAYYGKERLLAKGANIDVYLAQSGAMNCPTISQIYNEPGFNVIKAVKENKIYIIDEMLVSRPTLRLVVGMVQIASLLYPDIFNPHIDAIMKQSSHEFGIFIN